MNKHLLENAINEKTYYTFCELKLNYVPPVTSHMLSIDELSLGTCPMSLSQEGVPENRKTRENKR